MRGETEERGRDDADESARGEEARSRDSVGAIAAAVGSQEAWLSLSSSRCRFYRVKTQDGVREPQRERDRKKRRVRLVTLCRANFGTVLENFSLAAYRGKLGEISTWPIVLHYGSDEVHLPLARGEEIRIFGWDVAKQTFGYMSYRTVYSTTFGQTSFNS